MQGLCLKESTNLNLNSMFVSLSSGDLSPGQTICGAEGVPHTHAEGSRRRVLCSFIICWLLFCARVFMNLKFYFLICAYYTGEIKRI